MTRAEAMRLRTSRHWVERCKERGVPGDPDALFRLLSWARANGDDSTIELVKTDGKSEYWRFVPDGVPFYAVFRAGEKAPATVMTREMYRKKRWRIKMQRRGGRRGDFVPHKR